MADTDKPEIPMLGVLTDEEIKQRAKDVEDAIEASRAEHAALVDEVIAAIEDSIVAVPDDVAPEPEPVEFYVPSEDIEPTPLPNGQQTQPPEYEA